MKAKLVGAIVPLVAFLDADALTGGTSPAMIIVTVVCALIGLAGLLVDARMKVPS